MHVVSRIKNNLKIDNNQNYHLFSKNSNFKLCKINIYKILYYNIIQGNECLLLK